MSDNAEFLRAGRLVDSSHPDIVAFAREAARQASGAREQATAVYYAVRDGIRYDPYQLDLSDEGFKASTVLGQKFGWCVPKATLLAASVRALGIPARVGFADVRNHLSTERMRKFLASDVFYWHGYTSIFIDGRWVKATPAFNVELCTRFRLQPLEFDGTADSIYHPFDLSGSRHMEYLRDRGEFADVPTDAIREAFALHYPAIDRLREASFDRDAAREAGEPATR